jgi:uncharacterized protein (TIGR00661 family)
MSLCEVPMTKPNKKPVILFGVNSEGMGHATRALPVIQGLQRHYDVHVVCGGRAFKFFEKHVENVTDIWHIKLLYENNRLLLHKTIWGAFKTAPKAFYDGFRVLGKILSLRPVAIVTDYEPLTGWAGMLSGQKIVGIDNQAVISYGEYGEPDTKRERKNKQVMKNSNFWNHPLRHRKLITCFFQPPLKPGAVARGVRYVPTTVRPQVKERMGAIRTDGPVLVYQTSDTNTDLVATLKAAHDATGHTFAVYGAKHDGPLPSCVELKPFSEITFFDDMAAAPFVIVNGGHSTINEALALKKPVLAEPILDQYEQSTNVIGLEQMGVGRGTTKLCADDIIGFHDALPEMVKNAARVKRADTEGVVRAVMQSIFELNPKRAFNPYSDNPELAETLPFRPRVVSPPAA